MERAEINLLGPDKGVKVGLSLVAHSSITEYEPAIVSDGDGTLSVPMKFFDGNLNHIQTEVLKQVDDFFVSLHEIQENK